MGRGAGDHVVALPAVVLDEHAGVILLGLRRHVIREAVCPFNWDSQVTVQVVAFGPYIEVSVDDRVILSAVTMVRKKGRAGFFAEDGRLDVGRLSIQPLRPPSCQASC